MIAEEAINAERAEAQEIMPRAAREAPLGLRSVWIGGAAVLLLYIPAFLQAFHLWFHASREYYSHCVFIFPLSAYMLYLQKQRIRDAALAPSKWGLLPLGIGLAAYLATFLLHQQRFALWSLLPTLAGIILLAHGPHLWRIVGFAVLFLGLAAPFPRPVEQGVNSGLRFASASGAAVAVESLGYTLSQDGSRLSVPGYELDVAKGCSGYKKAIALFTFSLLYGYMFAISRAKRLLLVLASLPIALAANIVRVSALVIITSTWGIHALHSAHDWAEKTVLVLAFFVFVGFGKLIGCKALRFHQSAMNNAP